MDTQKDVYNLRKVILAEPEQFEEGFSIAKGISVPGTFTSIMISGMGGSALHADALKPILEDVWERYASETQRFSVYQNRFYTLPKEGYDQCLHLMCSHSGNTEETIASFEEAIQHNLPCIGLSSGGKLEALCKEHDVPHIKLPIPFENFQPRMATTHFIASIIQVLINQKMLPDVTDEIRKATISLKEDVQRLEEKGKELALTLKGRTPLIYAPDKLRAIAMIWKIKINENSKTPAFWNYFPELNHNEMVGFTMPQAEFTYLLLRDPNDDQRNQKRYDVFAELFKKKGKTVQILDIEGDNVYSRIFSTLYLGDWISYYLALEYGIDPTPVDMVEDFKKMLVE